MDKILINDLRMRCIIGIYPQERAHEQEVVINATLITDIRRAAQSDDIGDCVDYEKVSNAIRQYAQTARKQTVEALAQGIVDLCLTVENVQQVTIRIEKTEAIDFVASVGVEITRSRKS